MTLAIWEDSVRLAKIKNKVDPNSFTMIKGKLLKEAQKIYVILMSKS